MSVDPKQIVADRILRFQELLEKFEQAASAKAFRGAAHPDSWYEKALVKITEWTNDIFSEILDL